MTPNFTYQSRDDGRIGIIIPLSNTNLEPDCSLLVPAGTTTHFTRIGGYDIDAIPDSSAMVELGNLSLAEPIRLLIAAKVDVIGYGCASATLACSWEFDQNLQAEIAGKSGVPAVTTSGAMIENLRALGITSIGFGSPYVEELNQQSVSFFESAGIRVVNSANIDSTLSSAQQGKLTPHDAYRVGCAANHPNAEAIVIGCTDFRAVEAIAALERDLGKPVITSNQALIKSCAAKLGITP